MILEDIKSLIKDFEEVLIKDERFKNDYKFKSQVRIIYGLRKVENVFVPFPVGTGEQYGKNIVLDSLQQSRDRIVEKRVEVPVDRIVEKIVEKRIEVPVDRIVEKRVEVPVDRIVEKRVEVPVDRIVEKIVEKRIEVPVDRIVEKRIEVPVDRIVEKRVEVPVDRIIEKRVEVPVDRIVEKIVEKRVDKPCPECLKCPIGGKCPECPKIPVINCSKCKICEICKKENLVNLRVEKADDLPTKLEQDVKQIESIRGDKTKLTPEEFEELVNTKVPERVLELSNKASDEQRFQYLIRIKDKKFYSQKYLSILKDIKDKEFATKLLDMY